MSNFLVYLLIKSSFIKYFIYTAIFLLKQQNI